MDKLTRYREIIQKILKSYSDRRSDAITDLFPIKLALAELPQLD
jgi:hypothetical protein